jgi:hypothetical protein
MNLSVPRPRHPASCTRFIWLEAVNIAARRWAWSPKKLRNLEAQLPALGFEMLEPDLLSVGWADAGLTAYDAAYVAVAEEVGVQSITDDAGIFDVARELEASLASGGLGGRAPSVAATPARNAMTATSPLHPVGAIRKLGSTAGRISASAAGLRNRRSLVRIQSGASRFLLVDRFAGSVPLKASVRSMRSESDSALIRTDFGSSFPFVAPLDGPRPSAVMNPTFIRDPGSGIRWSIVGDCSSLRYRIKIC